MWFRVSQLENEINHIVRRSFMFHYRVFGGLKAIFAAAEVAICCILLTNCCRRISRVKTVADCSQTVCNLLQPIKILGLGIPTRLRHSRRRLGNQRCNKWARAALPGGRTRSELRSPADFVGFSLSYAHDRLARGVSFGATRELSRSRRGSFRPCQARAVDPSCWSQRDCPKLRLPFPW